VGTQLLWPRTVARKRASIPGLGFLAFGPLVVARVRTEQLDFLQEKIGISSNFAYPSGKNQGFFDATHAQFHDLGYPQNIADKPVLDIALSEL
jgi:hypothetical protein